MNDVISRTKALNILLDLTGCKTKRDLINRIESSVKDAEGRLGGIAEAMDEIEDMEGCNMTIQKVSTLSDQDVFELVMEAYTKENKSEIIKKIREAVTPKGTWNRMTGMMPPEYTGHYECSNCGWHGKYDKEYDYHFCPECGSQMTWATFNGTKKEEHNGTDNP